MPSKTDKQHRAMEAAAHGNSTLGIPQSVGQKFVAADAGKKGMAAGGYAGKRLVDHGDHFKVHSKDGKVHTIAKNGLHSSTVKHLQKFAEGGNVQKFAEKGEVEAEGDYRGGGGPGNEVVYPETRTPEQGAAADEEAARGEAGTPASYSKDAKVISPGIEQPAESKKAEDELYSMDRYNESMKPDMPGQEVKVPDEGFSGIKGSVVGTAPNGGDMPAGANPTASADAAAAVPVLGKYGSAKVSKIGQDEKNAVAEAAAARTGNAETQEALAKEQQGINERHVADEQKMAADSDAKMHELSVKGDQLRADIEKGTINPDHYWHEKGAGGRVMASIGLLLSGIGSGLGGGPNMAMQVIQSNIKRDIDAQEKNLETKKSLLSDIYRQTGDLRLSRQLAEHTLSNVYLAQLNTVAAKSSSAQVKATAQVFNAQGKLALAQQARGIADRQAANDMAAHNANVGAQNAMTVAQVKANGKGTKEISARTNFQIGALRQAKAALDELEKQDLSAGHAARSALTPGNRDKQNAEDLYLKYALESGKISKQGQPDKEEIALIRSKQPGVGTSIEDAHKSYIKAQREWLKGQARGVSAQMQQEGYTDPFGDIPEWSQRGDIPAKPATPSLKRP